MPDYAALRNEAIRVLANLPDGPMQWGHLLQNAGAPANDVPEFQGLMTRQQYWTSVVNLLENGALISSEELSRRGHATGLIALLQTALDKHYPANRDLPRLLKQLRQSGPANAVLKLLFLAANPLDTQALSVGREFERIKQRLADNALPVRIDAQARWAVEPQRLLGFIDQEKPDLVHFAGHGETNGDIVLESAQGARALIPPDRLAAAFGAINHDERVVRCVVLNACYARAAAEAIGKHVDAVIGSGGPIRDESAIAFAVEFYAALANKHSVAAAIKFGKVQVDLELPNDTSCRRDLKWPLSQAETSAEAVFSFSRPGIDLDRLFLWERRQP